MRVKLAIIGAGVMAAQHARKFSEMEDCVVSAVCDINLGNAERLAKNHGIRAVFTDFDKLLAEADITAVSIVVPDPWHHSYSMKALSAGKHVLCEKPLGLNHAQTEEMRQAAERAGVVNMVNFSYRNSSAIQKASAMVASGELGAIRHVYAHYHQSWLVQEQWGDWRVTPRMLWRLSKKHGSAGTLGDIGIHLLDFASMPVGAFKSVYCRLKSFSKERAGVAPEFDLEANDSCSITAEFSNGALGVLHTTRWASPHINSICLRLYGDRASVEIDLDHSLTSLRVSRVVDRRALDWEAVDCGSVSSLYHRFVRAIQTGIGEKPDFARGSEIQAVLDACLRSAEEDRTVFLG